MCAKINNACWLVAYNCTINFACNLSRKSSQVEKLGYTNNQMNVLCTVCRGVTNTHRKIPKASRILKFSELCPWHCQIKFDLGQTFCMGNIWPLR